MLLCVAPLVSQAFAFCSRSVHFNIRSYPSPFSARTAYAPPLIVGFLRACGKGLEEMWLYYGRDEGMLEGMKQLYTLLRVKVWGQIMQWHNMHGDTLSTIHHHQGTSITILKGWNGT